MSKDLIEDIVKSFVDYPNQMKIREVVDEKMNILELSVAEEDFGEVIGKHDRTLKIGASQPICRWNDSKQEACA